MANLFSQLGKDFVRSAVKQVGRDGGKVISNHVYGDGHSTPVREVGGAEYSFSNDIQDASRMIDIKCDGIMDLEGRKRAEAAGYTPKEGLNHWVGCFGVGCYVILVYIMFACCVYSQKLTIFFVALVLIRALLKYKTKSRVLRKPYRQKTYDQDRRYKTGQRYAGDILIDHTIDVELYDTEKKIILKRTIMYVVMALFLILTGLLRPYIAPYFQKQMDKQDRNELIQVDTTQVQESSDDSINLQE